MHGEYIFIDQEIRPAAEARIPVSDRGFRYGDALFETLRMQEGAPRFWEWHRARLQRGLDTLRIPFDTVGLAASVARLIAANAVQDGILRLQISRGDGGRGYLPAPESRPRLIIETMPCSAIPAGLDLWHSGWQRPSPRTIPNASKTAQGLPSILARLEAEEQGRDEALLCNSRGEVCELSGSALIWQDAEGRLGCAAPETGALESVMLQAFRHLFPSIAPACLPLAELAGQHALVACNAAWARAVSVHSLASPLSDPHAWPASNILAARLNAELTRHLGTLDAPHRAAYSHQRDAIHAAP